jgi:hypothetical protein
LRIQGLLQKEYERRSKSEQAQSQLLQSDVKFGFSQSYLDFYNNVLSKYGSSFSQADQQALRKFFVEETPLQWTVEDFERIGNMLKNRISTQDLGTFAAGIVGTVSTSTFEDPGGGMSSYLKRGEDFSNAMMRFMGSSMSYLPTADSVNNGLSLPAIAVAAIAGYVGWKVFTR